MTWIVGQRERVAKRRWTLARHASVWFGAQIEFVLKDEGNPSNRRSPVNSLPNELATASFLAKNVFAGTQRTLLAVALCRSGDMAEWLKALVC